MGDLRCVIFLGILVKTFGTVCLLHDAIGVELRLQRRGHQAVQPSPPAVAPLSPRPPL